MEGGEGGGGNEPGGSFDGGSMCENAYMASCLGIQKIFLTCIWAENVFSNLYVQGIQVSCL